ncbi:MAG: DUF6361 family protein [Acidimicrobiaceae bacterium]|nr:DUF6361 family protein [Acidimicrobiaceae bacterium]
MNDYLPASTLGWLDLDTTASERVDTLLRSLEEPSTLDVLGLGTVRDAFADMLSPGTSTVQTRLRYFIFLPWIFQRLEAENSPRASFASKLREAETRLIERLRHLGANQGVIGFWARGGLKRMPSEIYWGGLGSWGIRRLDMSIAQYGQSAPAPRSQLQRDDDGNATQRSASMWAAGISEPPEPFLWPMRQPSPQPEDGIDFDLLPDEARFLTERIRHSQSDSLLAVLSARPGLSLDGIDYPWLVPEPELLPSRLAEVLHHARCFSELTLGPQLVYNLLLAREANQEFRWDTKELEDDQLGRLEGWSRLIRSRQGVLDQWADHPEEFWQILAGYGISGTTRHFWNDSIQRAMGDPEGFAKDPMVHSLIRERERRLKSKRARLSYRAALENWHQAPVGGQLDYRWGITKTYLRDLAAAGVDG